MQCICQCSRSTPLALIQLLHPTGPSNPIHNLSPPHPSLKHLQPTHILAPPQPVSLPPISTFPEKDEPESAQQEPEPEHLELEPEQHKPVYGLDKLNQQFKSCMSDLKENVLKWHTEFMPEKYKTSFK